MSKICSIKVGGKRCGIKIALKDYATHLKIKHNMELIINPIQHYTTIHEQVEHVYDISNAALNKNGVLVDMVLRTFWHMQIYDSNTGRIEINMDYEDYIDYFVPFIGTIERAGRDLRAEARKHHELHPNWKFSDHVKVLRTAKEIAYRNFFKGRKDIEKL